ncbi:MAG: hypothetical protein ACFFA0_01700 [Promethearchaeota archaeon]
MKAKNLLIVSLILTSLFVPITLSSLSYANLHSANGEVEWGVREGNTYTWIVKHSLENFGFLPKNSEFKMNITSIRALEGGNATELNATITVYNSATELTTTLLDNATFAYFDSTTNTTILYTQIDDHALILPPNYLYGFMEGVKDYYGSFFNPKGSMTVSGIYTFYGYRSSTDLVYMWTFNGKGICDNFVAVDIDADPNDPSSYDYWLVLKSGEDSIPFGNFFFIFIGFSIIALVFIYKRKL